MTSISGSTGTQDTSWIIDSGASSHMSGIREDFQNLEPIKNLEIILGDGHSVLTQEKGQVTVQCHNYNLILSEVYFVPQLTKRLISVKTLTEKGYLVNFQGTECWITNNLGTKL